VEWHLAKIGGPGSAGQDRLARIGGPGSAESSEAERIYAADLLGSAAGAIVVVVVITWPSAAGAILLCAALGGLGRRRPDVRGPSERTHSPIRVVAVVTSEAARAGRIFRPGRPGRRRSTWELRMVSIGRFEWARIRAGSET
jgi:hypothetical protein